MLAQSDLSNSTENLDFILGKVVDILHCQCLAEVKEFAKSQSTFVDSPIISREPTLKKPDLRLEDKYREAIYFLFTQS